jgi:hypothetical protein
MPPFPCDAAGAILAVSRGTNAPFISAVPVQPTSYGPGGLTIRRALDLDGDGTADYILCSDINGATIIPLRSNSLVVTRSYDDIGPNTGVALLSGGDVVGPNSPAPDEAFKWFDRQLDVYGYAVLAAQRSLYGSTSNGGPAGVDGYVGLRFDSAGAPRYGWLHVFQYASSAAGQFFGWAYDSRTNSAIAAGAGLDSDQDGVWDYLDQCPQTPSGAVVDEHGCSIEQLCPCDGPWKNHGDYVSHVESVASRFAQKGLITQSQRDAFVKKAAASDCGKKY